MIRALGISIQSWFNGVWYERSRPPRWLLPFSLLYGAAVAARRRLYATRLRTAPIPRPVIVIGNLSVGGTGKTPLVCWLVAQLLAQGFKPGVVARGYGGSNRVVRRVAATEDPRLVGDESVVILRRTGVPVVIGRDRPAAARLLVAEGCNVVVSDDGLQHYALRRDCELVVVDGERRFGNGRLLPAGPLRESQARLRGVDAVIVNGGRTLLQGALGMRLDAAAAVALHGDRRKPLHEFAATRIHAVAGIGHPERFFNMLRAHGIEVTGHALADHARITLRDITFGDDLPVLMTEKDAVKCALCADARHWFVPVTANFDSREADALLATVLARIADRERQLSKGSING